LPTVGVPSASWMPATTRHFAASGTIIFGSDMVGAESTVVVPGAGDIEVAAPVEVLV
jgi:hypothetical protein